MLRLNKYIFNTLLLLYAVTVIVSCSASARYKILSTVFDGVPDPNARQKEIIDSLKIDSLLAKNKLILTKKKAVNQNDMYFFHPPYQNRMCKECHNVTEGNKLVKEVPALCYTCHEDLTEKNPALHGPVAMGNCIVCHSPHLARFKNLLKRNGNDLCFFCHESEDINNSKSHFATEEYDCLDCHNPHSGKNRFLLQ